MRLQVLLSAMNQNNHNILREANITSDAIIINQCDYFQYENFKHLNKNILFISLPEKGVGLSRNNALMRSTADIILFADEDIKYLNNYEKIIQTEFKKYPKSDMIIFNVPSKNPKRPNFHIKKRKRIRRYSCFKFATPRIAVKSDKIKQNNIYFSLLFGGGAKHSSGEDSIFIFECIKKGLKVYSSKEVIGYVSQHESTWFNGYDDKYFIDKGSFFESLSPNYSRLLIIYHLIKQYKYFKNDASLYKAIRLSFKGINRMKKS